MNRVSELEKGYLSGHPNKPLISQVTLLRAGKEKGQFLSEEPRSPDTNLTVFNIFLKAFLSSPHSYMGQGKPFPTASPPLRSPHPLPFLFSFSF